MSLLLFDAFEEAEAPPSSLTAFDAAVLAADRSAMMFLGGQAVIYEPASGPPVVLTGIFDRAFVLAKGDAQAGVEATNPAVFLRVEDLPEDLDAEDVDPILTIGVDDYRITERRPDGIGGIVLALRRVF